MKRFFVYASGIMEAETDAEIIELCSHAIQHKLGGIIEITDLKSVKLAPVTEPLFKSAAPKEPHNIGGVGKYGDTSNEVIKAAVPLMPTTPEAGEKGSIMPDVPEEISPPREQDRGPVPPRFDDDIYDAAPKPVDDDPRLPPSYSMSPYSDRDPI